MCIPCTVRAAFDIACRATQNQEARSRILKETMSWLLNLDYGSVPAAMLHTHVCRLAREISGNEDPFSDAKRASNELSKEFVSSLGWVKDLKGKEGLLKAAKVAILGNLIDFEVQDHSFSLETFASKVEECFEQPLGVDDSDALDSALRSSKLVLYLLDNAGEVSFDKLFIEFLRSEYKSEVWVVAKSRPVLNDATVEDVEEVGLAEVVDRVLTSGNDCVGVCVEHASEDLLAAISLCDLIIAKGQGNYETLTEVESELGKNVCYLLRAKCPLVAEEIGVPVGSGVIKVSLQKM
jgi:uncharacterized protein with ATP-grasp and redox domains